MLKSSHYLLPSVDTSNYFVKEMSSTWVLKSLKLSPLKESNNNKVFLKESNNNKVLHWSNTYLLTKPKWKASYLLNKIWMNLYLFANVVSCYLSCPKARRGWKKTYCFEEGLKEHYQIPFISLLQSCCALLLLLFFLVV